MSTYSIENLTIDKLQRAKDSTKLPIYYMKDDIVRPGTFIHIESGRIFPEFYIFHPGESLPMEDKINWIPLAEFKFAGVIG